MVARGDDGWKEDCLKNGSAGIIMTRVYHVEFYGMLPLYREHTKETTSNDDACVRKYLITIHKKFH